MLQSEAWDGNTSDAALFRLLSSGLPPSHGRDPSLDNRSQQRPSMTGDGGESSHRRGPGLVMLPLLFLGTASLGPSPSQAQALPSSGAGGSRSAQIRTPAGPLQGRIETVLGSEVVSYLGVPFAEPPVGSERFRPPKLRRPWNKTFVANRPAPACQQEKDTSQGEFWGATVWNAKGRISEDCLYLNLWAPKDAEKLPVMVWIFGGGFWYGSPSLALYDGRALAATGKVIVVNINYRVGPMGFLYLNSSAAPGNVGMLDQQLALLWLRNNVAAFGGDPERVTLFGESAGAASVVAHMIAPGSQRLFHRGILESGSLDNAWAVDSPDKAFAKSMAFVEALKCRRDTVERTVQCLQAVPAAELSANIWSIPIASMMEFPTVITSSDANFFRGTDALRSLRGGHYAKKQLIMGLNADEGVFWNSYAMPWFGRDKAPGPGPPSITYAQLEESVEIAFEKTLSHHQRQGVKFQYTSERCRDKGLQPPRQPKDLGDQVDQMVGDYYFTCDMLWLAEELVNKSGEATYVYYFNQRSSANPWPLWMGVMHGYEIEYVFGQPLLNRSVYTQEERGFSRAVMELWSSFAATGVPRSTRTAQAWRPYNDDRTWFNLEAGSMRNVERRKVEHCRFWRSVKDLEFRLHVTKGSRAVLASLITVALTSVLSFIFTSFR